MALMNNRWRVFVGYLAESTTYRNQRTFHVYVPEFLPTLTGDITPETATQVVNVTNVMTNQQESLNVATSTTITADYLGVLTSRSVPTMYKNQQVLVLNFASDDRFFWIPLERDDYLRTFEQIRWSALDQALTNKSTAIGTDNEAKQSGITDDNSYFIEIDTKYHKHIVMSTSASDGEAWRYYFKIDANSRSVEIWDESVNDPTIPSNSIILESQPVPGCRGRIKLENAAGTSITMEDKNMMIHVPKNLEIYVGGNLVTHVEGTTSSSFKGAVGTTMMDVQNHKGYGDASYNYSKNVGVAVSENYTLTVLKNITTNTPCAAIHNQGTRTVTTVQTDTVNSNTAIRNQMSRKVTTISNDTLVTGASLITAATGNWSVGSLSDVYVIDIPGIGQVPCHVTNIA